MLFSQFPVKSLQHHEKTAADHLGLNYVTERILASVLPNRTTTTALQQIDSTIKHHDNEFSKNGRPHNSIASLDDLPQDIYEQELISMLEQKHGKVRIPQFLLYSQYANSFFFFSFHFILSSSFKFVIFC